MTNKAAIINALRTFSRQRPGLEFCNYGEVSAYRAEMRQITRDLSHAQELLRAVEWSDIDGDALIRSANGGRLSIIVDGDIVRIDYCTGQYWPVEYRKAVCRVLASALWAHVRDGGQYPMGAKGLRAHFRHEFGRGIAGRYFN